jgi:acyl-CoA thioesterase
MSSDDIRFLGLDFEGDGRSSFELVPHLARMDGRLYGGAAVAVSVAAMEAETDGFARWTTVQFVGLSEMGERITCQTDVLASGRRTSQVRVTGSVGDRVVFDAIGATSSREAKGLHVQFADPPAVPPPDECPEFRLTVPKALRRAQGLEERASFKVPIEFRQASPAHDGKRIALWARVAGHVATPPMLGFLADFVPMGVARASGRAGGGVSLDNTIRFGPATEDEWVLVGLDPHFAYGGYGHGIAHLWAADGTLVATASQTASMVFFD